MVLKISEVICDLNYDAETISSLFDNEMLFSLTQIFNIIGGCIGLAMINYKMMIGIIFLIPIKMIIVKKIAYLNEHYTENYMESVDSLLKFEEDTLEGVKEIRIFGLQQEFSEKYNERLNRQSQNEKKLHLLPQINTLFDNTLAQICVLFIYVVGALFVVNETMTLGSIVAFVTYSSYVLNPISLILDLRYKIAGIIPAMKRVEKNLSLEVETDNGEDFIESEINHELVLNEVSFSYNEEDLIISSLSDGVKENAINAIIGENGKGKTTLINIMMRFLEPKAGNVLLAGKDIFEYSLIEYRKMIAYVPQTPFLFYDSLQKNLGLYKNISEDKMIDMCEKIGLAEFINKVGLDYNVGNHGDKLSGGQRQKVAIARAFLSDRKYLIFDESTSNLDERSKQAFIKLLNMYKEKHTIILISHDMDVIKMADNIINI